jgi:glucan phosphoethanolaminetransferase (alkaline phosphatase superfamily)
MEELSFETLIAVFEEMFGTFLFWGLVVVAAVITVGYIYVLIRDRAVSWRKFLLAQLSMPVGAVAAIYFVFWVTKSGFADMGGPIDVIVLLGVGLAGAIGAAILVYTVQSMIKQSEQES